MRHKIFSPRASRSISLKVVVVVLVVLLVVVVVTNYKIHTRIVPEAIDGTFNIETSTI